MSATKKSRAKVVILLVALISLGMFVQGYGSHSKFVDFGFRIWNLAMFLALIIYLWGGAIRSFFKNRSEGIARELQTLEKTKDEAAKKLKSIEARVASLDQECQAILDDFKAQGEALKADIIAKAETSAGQIIEQAKRTAANEEVKAREAIRSQLAEEVIAAAEKLLVNRLDAQSQEQLIAKSLTKVVLN